MGAPSIARLTPASEPETPEIARLRREATPDNPDACYALGEALLTLDRPDSSAEALGWFATAAQEEHPGGHYQLAVYYRGREEKGMADYHIHAAVTGGYEPARKLLNAWQVSGYVEFDDDYEAIRLLEEAVRAGAKEARHLLAVRLTQGRCIKQDPERVATLYAQSAEQGYAPAMHGLGVCYMQGYGIERDDCQAFRWFSEAAEHGHRDSWFALGLIHRCRGEHEEAATAFQHAGLLGQSDALFALAAAYGRGEGVPKDEHKMRRLTAEAAEKGHAESQCSVGDYYRYGEGKFPQDFERAAHWYRRASYADHPRALYKLGLQTLLGQGVERDIQKGWDLMEQSAILGEVEAMIHLGSIIDRGQAPVNDPVEALNWYRMAADRGNGDAQLIAGKRMIAITDGDGVARQYLKQAAEQGNAEAQSILDRLPAESAPRFTSIANLRS